MRALAVVAMLVAGCSIQHRSDSLACVNNSDCPGGRCEDNVCTNPNGGFDAPPIDPPETCPDQCSSCDLPSMSCRIDCAASGIDCTKRITCPTGWNCDILCSRTNDCRAGVDCQKSASCDVQCSGESSCRNIGCGVGPCAVACTGESSCRTVVCGNSCKCDVGCADFAACEDTMCQGQGQCDTFGGGCSSQFQGCSAPCP